MTENEMPPIRVEADQQPEPKSVSVPDPSGKYCDSCGKSMIPWLMTTADFMAWERSLKCAECYKKSIFKEEVKEFEELVRVRSGMVNP